MPICDRLIAALLAALLVLPTGEAFAFGHRKHKNAASGANSSPLTADQRVLQALNRLTFGPRPGDVAAVEAMGVDQWIDQQLEPGTIDDSALEARLAAYPAMKLSLHEMVERFPSPAMIRQAERGNLAIPRNAVERAIYNDQIAQLRERQEKQTENRPMAQPGEARAQGNEMAGGEAMSSEPAAPPVQQAEDKLYADLDATSLVNLPPEQRTEKLVAMDPAEFRGLMQHLSRPDRVALFADLTPVQRETVIALINPQLVVGGEVAMTRLLRDIYSERQLEAVMTDFWLNHFNVYMKKGPFAPWYLAQYQDDAIRPHALGKFEDLLAATAQSPAMLFYLDQTESAGPHSMAATRAAMSGGRARPLGINENYARELMELHTLGAEGGYTQRDVTEVAKVFTGWTIEHPEQGGQFFFNERRHEPGPKVVLGHVIRENGELEGREVLHMLAMSPATARHVSFQIAQRFVSDTPPRALVDAMAATWMKTGGDIREVLRTMLASPLFWSQDAYRAKVKTPEEYVISAVRASGGEVVHPAALVEAISQLGMPLYGCQTPNGYAWTAETWLNAGELLDRMNFSLALAENNAGTKTKWDELLGADASGAGAEGKESRLEAVLLDAKASAQTRNAVLAEAAQQQNMPAAAAMRAQAAKAVNFIRPREFGAILQAAATLPPPDDPQAAMLAGLLLGSPEFQRR